MASHRTDAFAVSGGGSFPLAYALHSLLTEIVFEDSAHLAILARNAQQVLSALSGLVPGLYTIASMTTPYSEPNDLARKISKLSLTDRRADFASLLLLYHLAHSHSHTGFHSTLIELTAPSCRPLRAVFSNEPPSTPNLKPFLPLAALGYAIRAAHDLAPETLNPVAYFSSLEDPSATTYERILLSWAKETMREKVWLVMQKAYLELGVAWAGRIVRLGESDLDVWVRERGGTVERGKVRRK